MILLEVEGIFRRNRGINVKKSTVIGIEGR